MRRGLSWLLASAACVAAVLGCRTERYRDVGDTVHPAGYADDGSVVFHGTLLEQGGYLLAGCRACHGDDYHGGSVGSSCVASGCHAEGVEACHTCHDAEPTSGAHAAHELDCTTCHPSRDDARGPDHPGGSVDVRLTGLARAGGASPSFADGTCADVYCHGGRAMEWEGEGPLDCGSCHEGPPASHAQLVAPDGDCTPCHAGEDRHLDGTFDLVPLACDGCHGAGPLGVPDTGAHARHLEPALVDRVGRIAACEDCHDVPTAVGDEGHLDAAPPADVALGPHGSYDASTERCVVACHWEREPGPSFADASGAERACDACHAMPPPKTRTGTAHPPAPAELGACLGCHPFEVERHVDGTVDFAW